MKELKLTSLNTVIFDGEELLLEEFFKILNNNLGEDYVVYYEEDTDRFKVIFDGVKYSLMLDKIIMNNYKFGIYNSFTYELKKLVDKSTEFEQEGADIEETILREEKIIKNAEKGLLPNDEARRVYLKYLKNNKKFSFSKIKIKSYVSNLVDDFKASCSFIEDWIFKTNIWPFNYMWDGIEYFGMTLIGSVLIALSVSVGVGIKAGIDGFFNFKYLYWFLLGLIPQTTYLVPVVKFLGIHAMIRFGRLRNFGKNKKLVNHKIKQLTEELNRKKIEDKNYEYFDKTLEEPIKDQVNPLEDKIMRNLYDIVRRLEYINYTDRQELLVEVRQIAEEYKNRIERIRKQGLEDMLQLGGDNYLSINQEVLGKIALLEQKMLNIRNNDVDGELLDRDFSQLMNAINNCSNAGDKVVGGERSRVRKSADK